MYVCLCNGITEHEVRECVADGARCLGDLESRLGVGSNCGKCREHAESLLDESPAESCNERVVA